MEVFKYPDLLSSEDLRKIGYEKIKQMLFSQKSGYEVFIGFWDLEVLTKIRVINDVFIDGKIQLVKEFGGQLLEMGREFLCSVDGCSFSVVDLVLEVGDYNEVNFTLCSRLIPSSIVGSFMNSVMSKSIFDNAVKLVNDVLTFQEKRIKHFRVLPY